MNPRDCDNHWIRRLRETAEQVIASQEGQDGSRFPEDIGKLLHELQVYHAELEIQNKELTETRDLLETSRNTYYEFFDQAPIGYLILDQQGIVQEVNLTLCHMLGTQRSSLKARPFIGYVYPQDHSDFHFHLSSVQSASGRRLNCTLHLRSTDQQILPTRVQSVCLHTNQDTESTRILVTVTDISEIVQAQQEREEMEAQFREAQKMEAVGRLAGGVAHDFNNMLSIIQGRAELMLMDLGKDDPKLADIQEIHATVQRSADLVRQLLAFARKQIINPQPLDLNDLVEGMLTMLRRLIGEDIDLAWRPGADLWQVKMDPAQVDQILANLCVNARDAISGVGKVTIETNNVVLDPAYCFAHNETSPGDFVLLAVSDNGCGMDAKTLKNMYEPFYTTKDVDKGTGLGLSTVYGIVKQNKGVIHTYSNQGMGTCIKMYFPRHYVEDRVQIAESKPAVPKGTGETILLVEDEPMVMQVTQRLLEKLGYGVLTATAPMKALHMAHTYTDPIYLLVTDMIMPEMHGKDLAEKIVTIRPQTRILFMSGYTPEVVYRHGVLDTDTHFLHKPFSYQLLAQKVWAALND